MGLKGPCLETQTDIYTQMHFLKDGDKDDRCKLLTAFWLFQEAENHLSRFNGSGGNEKDGSTSIPCAIFARHRSAKCIDWHCHIAWISLGRALIYICAVYVFWF